MERLISSIFCENNDGISGVGDREENKREDLVAGSLQREYLNCMKSDRQKVYSPGEKLFPNKRIGVTGSLGTDKFS